MNCARCVTGRVVRDLDGLSCLNCGHTVGDEVHAVPVTVRGVCGQGHPLVDGRCPACRELRGHATPANAEQRETMRRVVLK